MRYLRSRPPAGFLTAPRAVSYLTTDQGGQWIVQRGESMSLLIRRYKLLTGLMKVERIDEPERIERYLRLFEKADVKKLQAGEKVFIEKDEWQLLP
jgi:hypothetical protein